MNKKIAITNILAQISDHEREEAFRSIEHIESRPFDGMLKIRFHLSAVARMTVRVKSGDLVFEADGMTPLRTKVSDGIAAMRRFIYDLDALLADGYRQHEPKAQMIFSPPPPPSWMDIPIFDESTKTWHDAEI